MGEGAPSIRCRFFPLARMNNDRCLANLTNSYFSPPGIKSWRVPVLVPLVDGHCTISAHWARGHSQHNTRLYFKPAQTVTAAPAT